LSLESKKNAEACNVYNLYKLFASEDQTSNLKKKYHGGNFGYGQAKQELFDLICQTYRKERESFNYLINNVDVIEEELKNGAIKARKIAQTVLQRVRKNIGYY